ncbi:MAG: ABC transporter permease [Candidatus Eremiobacteraeota bacterium]|nr:ABC transporter permease [Candidatus Eremiobacteraeota bacterium]
MSEDFLAHLATHVLLSAGALALALAIGLPLGTWIARTGVVRAPVLAAVNTARVIPSLAVLMLTLPLIGLGPRPALVALAFLAIPPIVINTDLGLRSVPFAIRDAARGLGMSARQCARRVEWPLAFPIAFAGVRTATVEVIASATLAAFIGGGGLGEYITSGLSTDDPRALLLGAISVALLALAVDSALAAVQRRLTVVL